MPRLNPIQSDFSAGQVSPDVYGRYDTRGYKAGVMEMTNMVADPRGSAIRRRGFKHIARIAGEVIDYTHGAYQWNTNPVNNAVLHTFRYTSKESRAIIIVENTIYVISEGSAGGDEEISNGKFINGGAGWTETTEDDSASITFADNRAYLEAGGNQGNRYAQIHQAVSPNNNTGNYLFKMTGLFNGDNNQGYVSVKIGTDVDLDNIVPEVTLFGGDQLHETTFTLQGTTVVVVTIRAVGSNSNGSYIDTVSMKEDVSIPGVFFLFNSPWQEEDLHAIHSVMDFTGQSMYFTHGLYPPQKLTLENDLSWSFGPVIFNAQPPEWVAGNYPFTVTMYQGRSWWGGTLNTPTTFWASQSGSYENLDQGSAQSSDALQFALAENGRIRWMGGVKSLVIGTDFGEYIVTSDAGVITPSDIQVEQQSSFGSNFVQGVKLGNEMVFISPDSRRIRALRYQWVEDGFLSRDLTYISADITEGKAVDCMVIQNPDTNIWLSTASGELIGCSYHRDDSDIPVYGWHRHETVNGFFTSLTDINVGSVLEIWATIRRFVNGKNEIHIEHITEKDDTYLDGYIRQESAAPTNTVTGLIHLNGMTVQPVVDGAVENTKVVVDGAITTDNPGQIIDVGLNYTSRLVTLPEIVQTQTGSNASAEKRWSKVYLRVFRSENPIINGIRPPSRTPSTPMNLSEPSQSKDIQIMTTGFDHLGLITIEQDLPLRLWINMIHGTMASN